MNLTQPQIALLIGFCLSLGVQLPNDFPKWNGTNLVAFNAGKQLASTTDQEQGSDHD
jgi:hypothetical protein